MKSKYEQWKDEGELNNKLKLIKGWAIRGVSNDEIAKNLEMCRSAFYNMLSKHPDVKKALSHSKELADITVEDSLFKRACGYTAVETTTTYDKEGKVIGRIEKTKDVPPEVSAQIFWLKNRASTRWKDKIVEEEETDIPQAVQIKFVDASVRDEQNEENNRED